MPGCGMHSNFPVVGMLSSSWSPTTVGMATAIGGFSVAAVLG